MAQSSHWILEMISLCEKMEQFTYVHIIWVCLTLEESSKNLPASNLRASFYWEFIPSPPFFYINPFYHAAMLFSGQETPRIP